MINQQYLEEKLQSFKKSYHDRPPYPNIAIDQFLFPDSAQSILTNFPSVTNKAWTHYIHFNEKKHGLTQKKYFPLSVQNLINEMLQPKFTKWLEQLTGINNLIPDSELDGSGLHQTLTGGFLNIHADFTSHPKNSNWQRRVNVLIYFNENWQSEWGGNLELWNEDMTQCTQSISPDFNRAVIFTTKNDTYHGSPTPLTCPENNSRKSLAMYYYTLSPDFEKKSTTYKPRPHENSKKIFIWLDNKLISSYTRMKNILGINDELVSKILQFFNNK
jgi:hypothetical protein